MNKFIFFFTALSFYTPMSQATKPEIPKHHQLAPCYNPDGCHCRNSIHVTPKKNTAPRALPTSK